MELSEPEEWKECRWALNGTNLFIELLKLCVFEDTAWILSRTPTLNADVEASVNSIVEKYLDQAKLRVTIQDAET